MTKRAIASAMAVIWSAAIAVLVSTLPTPAIANEETKSLLTILQKEAVYVEVETVEGPVGGSGVVIATENKDRTVVLTCAHLFEHATAPVDNPIRVFAPGDGMRETWPRASAVIARFDGNRDLALLYVVEKFDRARAQVAIVQPENFSDVYTFGNPADGDGTAASGLLCRKRVTFRRHPGAGFYQITGFAFPGSSGGPVVDQWGRVIGIVSMVGTDRDVVIPQIVFAVDLNTIRSFLQPKTL